MRKKLLVGGYYDDRVFKGDYFDGKTLFNKNIDTYTVEEALKLGFVENVIEWHKENKAEEEKDWDQSSELEKAILIEQYTLFDEIAGMNYYETEEGAENFKNEVIEELIDLEDAIKSGEIKYLGKEQNRNGIYEEVYVYNDDCEE